MRKVDKLLKMKGGRVRTDRSTLSRMLKAANQALASEDNSVLQSEKKAVATAFSAKDTAITKHFRKRRLRRQQLRYYRESGRPNDSSGHTIADKSYIVVQGVDTLVPDETPDKNIGISGTRKFVHGTVRALGAVALSEKKPKIRSERVKLRDDEVQSVRRHPVSKPKHDKQKQSSRFAKKFVNQEHRASISDNKLTKAGARAPKEKARAEKLRHGPVTGTTTRTISQTKGRIPFHEPRRNRSISRTAGANITRELSHAGASKIREEISKPESDNVGISAAHKVERAAGSAGRRIKKLSIRSVKNQRTRSYGKLLNQNPAIRRNPIARVYYKRRIKRMYAARLRAAKAGTTWGAGAAKGAVYRTSFMQRTAHKARVLIKKAGIIIIKGGLLLFILMIMMFMLQLCMGMVGGGGIFAGLSYTAEAEDITQASIAYTEWETDLRLEILNMHTSRPGYDEYRLYVNSIRIYSGSRISTAVLPSLRGRITHDPFELMAFLTAVYDDFIFEDIRDSLHDIFSQHYQIRTESRTVTRQSVDYAVNYNWYILSVFLDIATFSEILMSRMDDDQIDHYELLVWSMGLRQFIYSPFAFNWLGHVSSPFGYRIHPISGQRSMHTGIDVAQPTGVELLAGISGTVTFAGTMGGYGLIVIITNEEYGIELRYAHCDQIFVSIGQTVSPGDVIATVGATGNVTGPHLHMEVRVNGRLLNPIFFVHTQLVAHENS